MTILTLFLLYRMMKEETKPSKVVTTYEGYSEPHGLMGWAGYAKGIDQ